MNKGKRVFKNLLFVILVIALTVGIYFIYTKKTGKSNVFANLVAGNSNTVSETDNYNGVYVYSEKLGESVAAFSGCTVDSLDQYIVVVDSTYYLYDYTCMGTYLKDEGNTTDLSFSLDDNSNKYKINYNDNAFKKDDDILSIVPGNVVKNKLKTINLSTYQFIMKYSQFEGNYFNVEKAMVNGSSQYWLSLYPQEDGSYQLKLTGKSFETNVVVDKILSVANVDLLPDIRYSFSKLILVEKSYNENGLYNYDLHTFDYENNFQFSLKNKFPINVSGDELSYSNNSIFVKYDATNRYYNILIGNDNDFCEDGSDSDEIAFYLFTIGYDSKSYTLGNPEYVKTYYKKDGCSFVNKVMGD